MLAISNKQTCGAILLIRLKLSWPYCHNPSHVLRLNGQIRIEFTPNRQGKWNDKQTERTRGIEMKCKETAFFRENAS